MLLALLNILLQRDEYIRIDQGIRIIKLLQPTREDERRNSATPLRAVVPLLPIASGGALVCDSFLAECSVDVEVPLLYKYKIRAKIRFLYRKGSPPVEIHRQLIDVYSNRYVSDVFGRH